MTDLVRGAWRFATGPKLDRQVVFTALRTTPQISSQLRDHGYGRTREWLIDKGTPDFGAPVSNRTLFKADKAIRLVQWRMKCLERSLAIWWMAGEGAVIRLGVAPPQGDSGHRFHAWVERDGTVVNDSPLVLTEFLPLAAHSVESADPRLFD